MSRAAGPTGFVRVIERSGGPVFYALIRTAAGQRLQRRLGPAWIKRSRPPAGYLTRAQAEIELEEILSGRSDEVKVEPRPGDSVSFRQACEEWMGYVEFDRKRRQSTIRDYRREIERRLIPEFGEQTPISEITLAEVDAFRVRMLKEGILSARTINKSACSSCTRSSSGRSETTGCRLTRSPALSASPSSVRASSGHSRSTKSTSSPTPRLPSRTR